MAGPPSENEIFDACRVLFGPEISLSREFLYYLQASGARSAYRQRAKETHPDLFVGEDHRRQQERARLFRHLVDAFDIVNDFLIRRDEVAPMAPPPEPSGAPERKSPAPERRDPGEETEEPRYHRGAVPGRNLEIGLYLFYRGAISYQDMIAALVWQRRQRPVIGEVALRWGWLSDAAIGRILAGGGQPGRFGDRAVDLGLLSPFQVKTLLFYQRCRQQRLGEFFIEGGLLTAAEMEQMVADLSEHNRRVSRASRNPRPAGAPAGG